MCPIIVHNSTFCCTTFQLNTIHVDVYQIKVIFFAMSCLKVAAIDFFAICKKHGHSILYTIHIIIHRYCSISTAFILCNLIFITLKCHDFELFQDLMLIGHDIFIEVKTPWWSRWNILFKFLENVFSAFVLHCSASINVWND